MDSPRSSRVDSGTNYVPPPSAKTVISIVVIVVVLALLSQLYVSVPAGHVAVATLFGEVQSEPYGEGLHVPVNPLYTWHKFDTRQKTHKETASVPSQDQLQTKIDVSLQYRLVSAAAPRILRETGDMMDMIAVHLVPKLRSLLREQGKTIRRAEDFFLEKTQEQLQTALLSGLQTYLEPKGLEVQAVLLRDITLPPFIMKAIEAKKEREQAVERQKAELERFKKEQEQKVAKAEAEKQAAQAEAERVKVLADAQAYEIKKINEAIADNPVYIQLRALDTLSKMSTDPSAKFYFIDGDSSSPLPLLHMGEDQINQRKQGRQ